MAEEEAQEKSEEPTGKRIKDAKEKGQIARSKDFNTLVVLTIASLSILTIGKSSAQLFIERVTNFLQFKLDNIKTFDLFINYAFTFVQDACLFFFPIIILIGLSAFIGPIIIGGWNFSMKSCAPKFERLNPLKGLKRMFSAKAFMELVKSFLKFLVVASVGIIVWYSQIIDFLTLNNLPIELAIPKAISILLWSFFYVVCSLIIIAAIDVPFQLFQHKNQLKMTKQQVKDEHKDTEGKPEVKSKIRRLQQEAAQRKMMQEVPNADVILINPEHYAVALKYDQEGVRAPTVIAKGMNHMAIYIGKIAKANEVPVMRLPPLTRAIYYSTELEQEIPRGLYIAVAQVLAYIYQLRRKGRIEELEPSPESLSDLPIPDELRVDPKE